MEKVRRRLGWLVLPCGKVASNMCQGPNQGAIAVARSYQMGAGNSSVAGKKLLGRGGQSVLLRSLHGVPGVNQGFFVRSMDTRGAPLLSKV